MKAIFFVLVLLTLTSALWARDMQREEANRLLVQASETSLKPRALGIPYVEKGEFVFYGLTSGNARGTYLMQWADKDNFLEEIRQGDYQVMIVHKDGKSFRHESMNFTPVRVGQLRFLLPPFLSRLDDTDIVRSIKDRQVNDQPARCLQFETVRGDERWSREVCVGGGDGRFLTYRTTEEQQFGRGRTFAYSWSAYEPFHGTLLPRHVEMMEGEKKIISADFAFAELPSLLPAAVVVPDGVEPVQVCARSIPPALVSKIDPIFPPGEMRLNGIVIVTVRVEKDGTVHDAQILETMSAAYDAAALRAVRDWKFSPGLCDAQPRAGNMNVQVRFKVAGNVLPQARVPRR